MIFAIKYHFFLGQYLVNRNSELKFASELVNRIWQKVWSL